MKKPNKDNIQKATERLMNSFPLSKVRLIPKFKDISEEDYFRLIKNLEIFSILILESYIAVTNSNI